MISTDGQNKDLQCARNHDTFSLLSALCLAVCGAAVAHAEGSRTGGARTQTQQTKTNEVYVNP